MYKSKGSTNGVIHLTSCSIPVQFSLPRLQVTVETRNVLVPADGAQVPLVLVVEIDCAERAPRGARADDAAVDEAGVAFKVLAVDGERACVLVEGLFELLALVEGVDLVFACACCVDAGAEEDTTNFALLNGSCRDGGGRGESSDCREPHLVGEVYGFVEAGCGV